MTAKTCFAFTADLIFRYLSSSHITGFVKDVVQVHLHFTYNVLRYATVVARCLVNMTPVVKVVIHCVFALL